MLWLFLNSKGGAGSISGREQATSATASRQQQLEQAAEQTPAALPAVVRAGSSIPQDPESFALSYLSFPYESGQIEPLRSHKWNPLRWKKKQLVVRSRRPHPWIPRLRHAIHSATSWRGWSSEELRTTSAYSNRRLSSTGGAARSSKMIEIVEEIIGG